MEQSPPPPSTQASDSLRAWDRPLVMLPLFVLIAAVGGLFASFTSGSLLLVLAVGGTMVWLGLSGRVVRRPAPVSLPRATVWWLLPILALALVELYAFTRNSPEAYPTLSLLADPVLEVYLARALAYFLWLAAFWGLVRR
jgi:hypothetical protein